MMDRDLWVMIIIILCFLRIFIATGIMPGWNKVFHQNFIVKRLIKKIHTLE